MGILKVLSNEEDVDVTYTELDNRFKRFVIENNIKISEVSSREDCRAIINLLYEQAKNYQNKYYYVPSYIYELLTKFSLAEHKMNKRISSKSVSVK